MVMKKDETGMFQTEIVTGDCPECKSKTMLVRIFNTVFRCVNCGYDLEQKINGVIKYVIANDKTEMKIRNLDEEHG